MLAHEREIVVVEYAFALHSAVVAGRAGADALESRVEAHHLVARRARAAREFVRERVGVAVSARAARDYQNLLLHAVSRGSRLRGARASKPQPAEHRSAGRCRERRFQKIASVHKNSPRR